jgi:nitric oxide dioxygenase
VIVYGDTGPDDERGVHYDAVGALTTEVIREYMPTAEADYYYCGPIGFMTEVEAVLDTLKVKHARRFSEAFAPDPYFATPYAPEQVSLAAE